MKVFYMRLKYLEYLTSVSLKIIVDTDRCLE